MESEEKELGAKVSVHWVHITSTKRLASGKKRRYTGKRRFKMYISHGDGYLKTKYVGLGTFLYYNKRLWLLPLAGVGLFLVRGFWLPYLREALRLLGVDAKARMHRYDPDGWRLLG